MEYWCYKKIIAKLLINVMIFFGFKPFKPNGFSFKGTLDACLILLSTFLILNIINFQFRIP